jgi:hypothetical protein
LIETEGLTAGDVERLLRTLEQKRRLELEDEAS